MFLSMTGFGSKSYDFSWGTVVFELSSINHKFQDFLVKLPPELSVLENRMLNIMRSSIGRGRVKLSASITWTPGAEVPQLDEEGLINLFNQIRNFTKKNNLDSPNDITNLLLIPGLFSENNNLAAQEVIKNPEIWDRLAREAIDALMEMKKSAKILLILYGKNII